MKKVLYLVIIIIVATFFFFSKPKSMPLSPSPSPSISPTLKLAENEHQLLNFSYKNLEYRYVYQIIDPQTVTIGVNVATASTSSQLKSNHYCRTLTNGGFYDTNNQPLGLLVNQNQELSPYQPNSLLNGILGYNQQNLSIDNQPQSYIWAIQAGPILINNYQPLTLILKKDQPARRLIAGITVNNQLLLLMIITKDSLFTGPYLADLPKLLINLNLANTALISAINLDGGTASAWLTNEVSLKELRPIGSFICVP